MPVPVQWMMAYLLAANLLAVIYTVADKCRAKKGKWRVAESTLFLIAVLGGAAAMLATMRCIRHKTKHKRFMWGLPAILVAQTALLLWLYFR